MSAIAGLIDWRGGPAGPAVKSALDALYRHGRDGHGMWDGGDIALGWRQTILQAEDYADSQPLTGGGGRFKVVFDGRLDNREELAKLLALAPEQACDRPDSAFVMAAFEKWGEDFAARLIGDFAIAIWNSDTRELLLARDAIGARPLTYYCGAHFFAFATHPAALFTHPEIARVIDDATIMRQVMRRLIPPGDTMFRGIDRVLDGHVMSVSSSGTRLKRYWAVEDTPPIRFARDDDYVEAFRACFTEGVRCRLRTIHPVGSQLSSGWDSGSNTSVAAPLLAGQGKRLYAYTSVPRRDWVPAYRMPGRIADEGPLAAKVAARHPNIDHMLIEGPGIFDFRNIDHFGACFGRPMTTWQNAGWFDLLYNTARSQGVRVMLSGGGGNITISYDGIARLALLLRQGRLLALWHEWRAAHAQGKSIKHLIASSVLPLLPSQLDIAVRAATGRRPMAWADLAMLTPSARPQAQALLRAEPELRFPHRREFLPRFCTRGRDAAIGYSLAAWDMDTRSPVIDRRVIAFCYAVPDDQFFADGQSRRLLRRAMTGVLPEETLTEKRRGRQAADWCEAAVKARPALLDEVALQASNAQLAAIIDLDKIRTLIQTMDPEAIATNTSLSNIYRQALIPLCVGRFVRRELSLPALQTV